MVSDFNPGPDHGILNRLEVTVVGDVLFFGTSVGLESFQLWRTDGTDAGTYSLGVRINGFGAASNGLLIFSYLGDALWRSDGTRKGTLRISGALAQELVDVDGTVFFDALNAGAPGLWKTDGTSQGTVFVSGAADATLSGLGGYRGRLYFSAQDDAHGRELWTSDGTFEGTVRVSDITQGPASSLPGNYGTSNLFYGFGDRIFFVANDGASGSELWAYRVASGR
jgi:ELWxxDGT repeat protein